jgi:hypothetical protein
MSWQDEQAQFWAWINRPQDLNENAEQIAHLLAPHSRLSQAEALSIYNNAYHQRLVDVSSAVFPVLYNSLGKEIYTRMWIAYMGKFPPRHGPIHHVGEQLPEFLRQHEQFRSLPAVADIAQLEYLLTFLFDRVDEIPCTLAQLQALAPEAWPGMRWQAKQDWALLYSRFDLEQYWRQMQEFISSGAEAGSADFGIQPLSVTPTLDTPNYLVLRRHLRMQFQAISAEMAVFLTSVQQGADFSTVCATLAEKFPQQDIPALSLSLLLKAIELELLCSVTPQS